MLQKARATLQLGEDSSARIHSQMYDAQLGMLLEGDGAGLDDSALALLGELEAMLQLRGSSGLMQARTVPMYRAAAASELRALLDGKTGASVWGSMAVRQQQLSLPSDRSKPVVVEEARRIALEQLAAAATAQAAGRTDEAQATLQKLLSYASAYGTMLQAAAWEADLGQPRRPRRPVPRRPHARRGARGAGARARRGDVGRHPQSDARALPRRIRRCARRRARDPRAANPNGADPAPGPTLTRPRPPRRTGPSKERTLPCSTSSSRAACTRAPPCARGRTSSPRAGCQLGLPAALRQRPLARHVPRGCSTSPRRWTSPSSRRSPTCAAASSSTTRRSASCTPRPRSTSSSSPRSPTASSPATCANASPPTSAAASPTSRPNCRRTGSAARVADRS